MGTTSVERGEGRPGNPGRKSKFWMAFLLAAGVLGIAAGCVRNTSVGPTLLEPVITQVTAKYDMWAHDLCPDHFFVYQRVVDAYTWDSQCAMPGYETSDITDITQEEFNREVYVTGGFIIDPSPYVEYPASSFPSAPAGTTRCWQTPDQVNTLCCNADNVITYEYYDGNKLGLLDANFKKVLVLYEEK